jgi:hypothetical protein
MARKLSEKLKRIELMSSSILGGICNDVVLDGELLQR